MKTNELAGDAPQEGTERERKLTEYLEAEVGLEAGSADVHASIILDLLGIAPSGEPKKIALWGDEPNTPLPTVEELSAALATAPREQEPDEEVATAARRKRDIDRRGELLAREQEPVPRWKRRTVFGCPHCDAEFDTPRWCRLHIIEHHEEPRCPNCEDVDPASCAAHEEKLPAPTELPTCRHGFKWPDCLNCHRPLYRTVPGEEHIPNNGSTARKSIVRNESTPTTRANVDKAAARAPKMILRCGRCERKIPGDFVFNPCPYCPKV